MANLTFQWEGDINATGKIMQNGQEIGTGSGEGGAVNSIEKIEFTSSTGGDTAGIAGATDTYTITFTDESTATFNVYNGTNGEKGNQGEQGEPGNGIMDIHFVSSDIGSLTPGTPNSTDTYQIILDDGTTYEFFVYNGRESSGTSSVVYEDVAVTVGPDYEDDDTQDIFGDARYNTIDFALTQADLAGIRRLIIYLEDMHQEELDLIYHYDYLKICRPDTAAEDSMVDLTFNYVDIGDNATVIFDLWTDTDIIFNDSNICQIENFGKMYISGQAGGYMRVTINTTDTFKVTGGSHLIISGATLDIPNGGNILVTNGAQCTLTNTTWADTTPQQNGIHVQNGGILTSKDNATQSHIYPSGTNSGVVIINNQFVPH